MSRKLFVVEEAVVVEKRGVVLLPGLAADDSLAGNTEVELRLPNGTSTLARVAGMAHFGRKPGSPSPLLLALSPPDLVVPRGTEVWTF